MGSCLVWEDPNPIPLDAPTGVTLPAVTSSLSSRIFVLGDQGTGDANQEVVADALVARHASAPAQAVVLLGDNFYPSGVRSISDSQWNSAFRMMYPAADLPVPFYAVMGNHDYRGNAQAQYDYQDPEGRWILDSPAEVLPIWVDGLLVAELFLIDSEQIIQGTLLGDDIVRWVTVRAESSLAPWRFLALHHAPRSHGVHGNSPEVLRALWGSFVSGRFTAVLAGHDHHLELSRIWNTDFIVSGAGAKIRPLRGGSSQIFGVSALGFVEIVLTAATCELIFRDGAGAVLYSVTRSL